MGEEVKQEEAKPEQKTEQVKTEEAPAAVAVVVEEKKVEEPPKPPSPFVLYVDLHCVGCARKIEKSILKIRGVEGVVVDMGTNQVTIKGVVEPQAICTKIMKITKRKAQVLSPLPAAEGEPMPQVVNSQVSGLTTVELTVNMHCEACAEQLKKKILKMRGVRTVTTELKTEKVTVTGTMEPDKLVEYVYRRTKKQARIVPQPEPEKPAEPEPMPPPPPPPAEEPKPEEKKEEALPQPPPPPPPQPPTEGGERPLEEGKKEGGVGGEESNQGGGMEGIEHVVVAEQSINNNMMMISHEEQSMQKMMHYYQPLYYMERIPPPQLFSDENPNACCIT